MFRKSLLAVALFTTACGMESEVPRRGDETQPLTHQPAPRPPPSERLQIEELTPALRLQQLQPVTDVLSVHSLAAPDGTKVPYVLGMMGCGIWVVASGTATVQGGAFDIAYDPELVQYGQLSLYFRLDELGTGACDPQTTQVYEVPAELPGSIDLSVLPQESFAACWLFDN